MGICRAVSKDKLASGPLRVAVGSGLAVGLAAAASLGGVGPASATCIGLSGIDIGLGGGGVCTTSLGSFALGIGPDTTAISTGFINGAIATGNGTSANAEGSLNFVVAGGSQTTAQAIGSLNSAFAGLGFEGLLGVGTSVEAYAGQTAGDFLNFAINLGAAEDDRASVVEASYGAVNLAGNLFGNANADISGAPMIVYAGGSEDSPGYGTVAANVFGNRNRVEAIGVLNNATNWGNIFTFPNGSDNTVTAGTVGSPAQLSWAFNTQGIFTETCPSVCSNIVNAGPGPFAVAGAIGVTDREVTQTGGGITLATRFNTDTDTPATFATTGSDTATLAADGTQRSRVRSGLNAAFNRPKVASPGGSVRDAVSDRVTRSTKRL